MLGREVGVITSLLHLLKQGSSKAKERAAKAIENLALNDWNKTKIIQEGGVECLMQLLKDGTLAEQEIATIALKTLKVSTSFEKIQQQEGIDGNKNCNNHEVELSNQPMTNISGHVENVGNEDLCKSIGYQNRKFTQEKEMTTNVAPTTMMDDLQHSNNYIYENSQISKNSNVWQNGFSRKNLILPRLQSISASELTSSLAPPLIGQPSMQIDAILENIKKPIEPNLPSSKRMKMTIPHIQDNQNTNVPPKKNVSIVESKVQNFKHPIVDSIDMRHSNANKRNLDEISWNKSREHYQRNQCFSPSEGYGLSNTIRDQQTRQCLVVDNQLVAGGIVALVNALSSPNPNAQEFAALALMLLASQGGFEVKTTISDAGIYFLF